MSDYKGAVRGNAGANHGNSTWSLNASTEQVLAAAERDDEDPVIWVSTIEELYATLEGKYPGRVTQHSYWCQVHKHHVVDANRQWTTEEATAHVLAAARAHGSITVVNRGGCMSGLSDECVTEWTGDGINVTYDPTKARRVRERQERASARAPLTNVDLIDAVRRLEEAMPFNRSDYQCNEHWSVYVRRIRTDLWLLGRTMGRGYHRRLPCWQALVREWRGHGEPTAAKWEKGIAKSTNGDVADAQARATAADFVEFMRRECARRLPKPLTAEEVAKRRREAIESIAYPG